MKSQQAPMISPSRSTSLSLLAGIKAREPLAWSQLVRLYAPLLQAWCREYGIRQSSDVEDVLQEILLEVGRSVGRFQRKRRGSFRQWLKRITQTRCADFHRRHQQTEIGIGGSDARQYIHELPDQNTNGDTDELAESDAVERRVAWQRAMQLIREEVGEKDFVAWQRFVRHGDSAKHIARDQGVSLSTFYRSIEKVKRLIRERYDPVIDGENSGQPASE